MARAKVLLVDDDPDFVEIGRTALESNGEYEVVTAFSADEALEKARLERPDAVVVDMALDRPDSGLEVVRCLRSEGRDVPVMLLTANSSYSRLYDQVDGLGVRRMVRKPVEPRQFVSLVGRLMHPAFYELEPMGYEI